MNWGASYMNFNFLVEKASVMSLFLENVKWSGLGIKTYNWLHNKRNYTDIGLEHMTDCKLKFLCLF